MKAIDALAAYVTRLRGEGARMDSDLDLHSKDRWHNRPGIVEEPSA